MLVAALLEADVVVGADARQQRQLLATQPGDAATAEVGEVDVLGADEGAAGAQEAPDAVLGVHADKARGRGSLMVALGLLGPPLQGAAGLWLWIAQAFTV